MDNPAVLICIGVFIGSMATNIVEILRETTAEQECKVAYEVTECTLTYFPKL